MNTASSSYQCGVCKEVFVVRMLARCCEMKHDGVVFVRLPEQEPRTKDKP